MLIGFTAGNGVDYDACGPERFDINVHNTSARMKVLGENLDVLYSLSYTGVRRVLFDYPTDEPLFHDDIGDWGYDELTAADDDYLRHEILFASGTTILIEFKHFSYEKEGFEGTSVHLTQLTAACTRPPTRTLSSNSTAGARRVMPGVSCSPALTPLPYTSRDTLMDLQESWDITRRHLERARHLLAPSSKEVAEGGSLSAFEEFLSHNELGLAFDEPDMIGMDNPCPPEFWREMLAAAESMQLFEQAERCRAKLM